MDQHDPAEAFHGSRPFHGLPGRQLDEQIHCLPFAPRRVGEDFLVQPFGAAEIEAARPLREEHLNELREEFSQGHLEPLVVVGHAVSLHPFDRQRHRVATAQAQRCQTAL
jgi:hypothetical protein